ncbi:MAG: hypothetical protein A2142_06460 [candidate division Zixibacteria bacterium RBG_16_48_11]|nr:MAG: hypothetical protein A2142_06460 [candidate division Zixibacteria bacterium RBG_16_48_11]
MGERTFWGLKIDKKFSPKISLIYAMLEQDRRLVKDKVRKLQPAHLLWRSDKKTNTVGTLLLHIAEAELWWMQEVIDRKPLTKKQKEEFRYDLYGGENTKQIGKTGLDYLFSKMDKVRRKTRKILQKLSDRDLDKVHKFKNDGMTYGYILFHLIEHEASHAGQISSLINRMKKLKLIKPKPQS